MSSRIATITNDDDDSFPPIVVHEPSESAWTEFQDETGRDQEAAQMNLLIACASSPSGAELSQIVDDWPALPRFALGVVSQLGGAFADGYDGAMTFDLAEVVKAAEAQAVLQLLPPEEQTTLVGKAKYDALEPLAKIAEALGSEGFTIERAKDALARWKRKGQVLGIYAPSIGYFVGHRPSFSDLSRFSSQARRGKTFDPQKRLVFACSIHPSSAVIDAKLKDMPAAVSVLCAMIKESADEVNQTVKKG
jgi:hypothetical protein